MNPAYDVNVEDETGAVELDIASLGELVERVLAGEAAAPGSACTVGLTGDEELRRLNREFRDIDAPTDVLSFEMGGAGDFPGADDAHELGDVVISIDTARRQAAAHGWDLRREVEHLVVHGLLHLCGWDHERGEDAEARMRAREEHYLGPLGPVHDQR